jgi:hypothetical protein
MPRLPLIPVVAAPSAPRFSPICFHSAAQAEGDDGFHVLRAARTDLCFDQPLSLTSRAEVAIASAMTSRPAVINEIDVMRAPDFIGSGWLGQTLRNFECWVDAAGQRIRFQDGADVCVSADGDHIQAYALPMAPDYREEVLLGPALVLALSLRGVFGLHASAVLGAEGAVAVLGPSGSGKSSLARQAVAEGSLRLSDDVTPVTLMDAGMRVLPRFPQLKLNPAMTVADLELPLAAMVWVEIGDGALALAQLATIEASRCLLRDTVASRLFAPALLARHLDFCVALAQRTPAWRLQVPRVAPEHQAHTLAAAYRLLRGLGLP